MGLISMVVIGLVVFVLASYLVTIYNGLIAVSHNINKAWANIDVLLTQRHDEIPKLIGACEGYMAHERGVFDRVLKAREALFAAQGPEAKGAADGELRGVLSQLFALAESYPQLKAQESFQQLQTRISSLESSIADRREFYNDSVNTYNIRIHSMPDVFLAMFMGMTESRAMFKATDSDKADVKVEFKPS